MKASTKWFFAFGVSVVFFLGVNQVFSATIFIDSFESGTAGASIGSPWAINTTANPPANTASATYQTASNPFASGGTTYGDMIDTASNSGSIRVLSTNGNDNSLVPSLTSQVSTFSFDFDDLGGLTGQPANSQGFIAGYYRQQANPDLNGAGRSYGVFLHNGTAAFTGAPTLAAYTQNTVNTLYIFVNDSAATITNYAGSGHDLAPTSEDVWIAANGGSPTYLFTAAKQNTGTPTVSGIGFRSFNGDIEHFQVDNVLLTSGATFDRSAVPEPASVALVSVLAALLGLSHRASCRLLRQG